MYFFFKNKVAVLGCFLILVSNYAFGQYVELLIDNFRAGYALGKSTRPIGEKVLYRIGKDVWVSDGTKKGTEKLLSFNTTGIGFEVIRLDDSTSFVYAGKERFITNGTVKGTTKMGADWPDATFFDKTDGSMLYGLATDEATNVWKFVKFDLTDGTSTVVLENSAFADLSLLEGNTKTFVPFRDKWLFITSKNEQSMLYISDATQAGTIKIAEFGSYSKSFTGFVKTSTKNGEEAFFRATTNEGIHELWKTDGTADGTIKLRVFEGYKKLPSVYEVENGVVFPASKDTTLNELWFSDGTAAGTTLLKGFEGAISMVDVPTDKKPFFINHNARPPVIEYPYEIFTDLYRTDGTAGGTTIVFEKDFWPLADKTFMRDGNYLYGYNKLYKTFYDPFSESEYGEVAAIRVDLTTNKFEHIMPDLNFVIEDYYASGGKIYSVRRNRTEFGYGFYAIKQCKLVAKINAPDGKDFCKGNSVVISGEGIEGTAPFIFRWKQGVLSVGATDSLIVTKVGSYVFEVMDKSGCIATDSVAITLAPDFEVEITGDTFVCSGRSAALAAEVSGGAAPYIYVWNRDASVVGFNSNNLAVTAAGNYSVNVMDRKGCFGVSAGFEVAHRNLPDVNISKDGATEFLSGEGVTLSVPAAAEQTYQWQKDGTPIAGATNSAYTASSTGVFDVIIDRNGCSAVSEKITVSLILSNETFQEAALLKVYPNPVQSQIKLLIEEPLKTVGRLRLVNQAGINVREWNVKQQENVLDVDDLPTGVYLLRGNINEKLAVLKIIK